RPEITLRLLPGCGKLRFRKQFVIRKTKIQNRPLLKSLIFAIFRAIFRFYVTRISSPQEDFVDNKNLQNGGSDAYQSPLLPSVWPRFRHFGVCTNATRPAQRILCRLGWKLQLDGFRNAKRLRRRHVANISERESGLDRGCGWTGDCRNAHRIAFRTFSSG